MEPWLFLGDYIESEVKLLFESEAILKRSWEDIYLSRGTLLQRPANQSAFDLLVLVGEKISGQIPDSVSPFACKRSWFSALSTAWCFSSLVMGELCSPLVVLDF